MTAETPQTNDPRRVHPDHVVIDDDSAEAIEDAVAHLSTCRSPMTQGDGALRVHVLASLNAQACALLADAVADARDQDHPWADIANSSTSPSTRPSVATQPATGPGGRPSTGTDPPETQQTEPSPPLRHHAPPQLNHDEPEEGVPT